MDLWLRFGSKDVQVPRIVVPEATCERKVPSFLKMHSLLHGIELSRIEGLDGKPSVQLQVNDVDHSSKSMNADHWEGLEWFLSIPCHQQRVRSGRRV